MLASRSLALLLLASVGGVSGCKTGITQTITHGYQLDEDALALVPEGSSREQVLLSLGTPSTTTKSGSTETFYYISQKRQKRVAFAKGSIVNQRVLAVYFGGDETVTRIANYGLKDGKVFDFKRRVTATAGKDISFIGQMLAAGKGGGAPKSIFSK